MPCLPPFSSPPLAAAPAGPAVHPDRPDRMRTGARTVRTDVDAFLVASTVAFRGTPTRRAVELLRRSLAAPRCPVDWTPDGLDVEEEPDWNGGADDGRGRLGLRGLGDLAGCVSL